MNEDIDHLGQDEDDCYQDIVVEDAASVPDGCLGVIVIAIFVLISSATRLFF